MNVDEALAFVRSHGVVLVSARGPVPRLTEAVVGAPVAGSWWAHPQGRKIFAILQAVSDSDEVLVCRLVGGKLSLVHRRLWPALARVAPLLGPERVAQVREEHTPSGRHATHETPFPAWVPADVAAQACALDEAAAFAALGEWSRPASARATLAADRPGGGWDGTR